MFKKNGAWWIDYTGADGQRHRRKAAPTYELAKLIYRDSVTAIAKGEVLGLREGGIRVRAFTDEKYWPVVQGTLMTLANHSYRFHDGERVTQLRKSH